MWKVAAQRALLRGNTCRSISRCCGTRIERARFTSSTIPSRQTDNGRPQSFRVSPGDKRRRRRRQRPESKPVRSPQDAKRFLESAKGFLEQASERNWTRDELEMANRILCAWSTQSFPADFQPSWLPMADRLMSRILQESSRMATTTTSTRERSTDIIPDSAVFCNIIVEYSKSNLPDSAERADFWLQNMIETSNMHPERVTPPRPTLFANVLSAWERSRLCDAETRAEKLWKQLKATKGLSPTSSAYYLLVSLYSKSDSPKAAEKAEKILRELVREGRRNPKLTPSCPVFVNAITAWRRNKETDGNNAQCAQAVLDLMVKEFTRRSKLPQQWMRFTINDVPFNATIDAWAKSSTKPILIEEKIDHILNTMQELNVDRTMVTAWSALPLYYPGSDGETTKVVQDVPAKILRLLDSSLSKDGGAKNPLLQCQIYTKALEICSAHSGNETHGTISAAEIAEEIFLNRYFKRPRGERRMDTTISGFEHCIQAWNNDTRHSICHKKARILELLQNMEKEVDHVYMHTHKQNPSVAKVYASLAKAWTMSSYPTDALERAQSHIDRLLTISKAQPEFKPSPFWFQDIARVAIENYSEDVAADFVHQIYSKLLANESRFFRMMKEDLEVPEMSDSEAAMAMEEFLSGVLDTLVCKRGNDSGRLAEIILLKQQELFEDGNCLPPTFETFKKVLTCWSNSQEDGAAERMENMLLLADSLYDAGDTMLRPDFDGYMSVITAWSRSHSPDAPDKIQSHLKTLHQRRLEGDQTFTIDSPVYAALIRAYANSGRSDAQRMAYSIFQSAPDHLKDTSLYNLLIEAQGGDSSKAEELLQVMHISYFEGNQNVKPDTETFNAVIQTWLRSGSPMAAWRADGIFKRMEEMTKTGKLDVKPNSRTFDLVISTLAQDWGAELGKVDVYLALLKQHYLAGDCVPTVTSYTEAIRAWASKNDDPRAILRAQALLDEMHELVREGVDTVRPNRDTYEVFLEGVSQSSLEDRSQLVNDVLFKMKENEFDLDRELRSSIQRCLLPVNSRSNSWIVDVDECVNPKNEWVQSNRI